jgi:hypothetical protein
MYLRFSQTPTTIDSGIDTRFSVRSFALTFSNIDLVNGVLTVGHGLDSTNILVHLYNPEGEWTLPTKVTPLDNNQALVSLEGLDNIVGTWRVVIMGRSSAAVGSVSGYTRVFEQGDLVGENLVVTHSLGSSDVLVQVYDGNGYWYDPFLIDILDDNTVNLSFRYGPPLLGEWRVVIAARTGLLNNMQGTWQSFSQDNVYGDVVVIGHGFSTKAVIAQVFDNTGELFVPTEIKPLGTGALLVSFKDGVPLVGQWYITILALNP